MTRLAAVPHQVTLFRCENERNRPWLLHKIKKKNSRWLSSSHLRSSSLIDAVRPVGRFHRRRRSSAAAGKSKFIGEETCCSAWCLVFKTFCNFRPVTNFRCCCRDLHGLTSIQRQEIPAWDCRHCWRCWRHHSPVVQIDAPTCSGTLPRWLQFCNSNRTFATELISNTFCSRVY